MYKSVSVFFLFFNSKLTVNSEKKKGYTHIKVKANSRNFFGSFKIKQTGKLYLDLQDLKIVMK